MGSGIGRVARCLVALGIASVMFGCGNDTVPVDSASIAKEIAAPKNTNTGFTDKMAKYKIGEANSPPGMKNGEGPQAVQKGGK